MAKKPAITIPAQRRIIKTKQQALDDHRQAEMEAIKYGKQNDALKKWAKPMK